MGERRQLQRLAAVWLLLLAAVACHARPQDAATTKPGVDNVVTSGALPTTTTTTAAKDAQQEKEVARDVSNSGGAVTGTRRWSPRRGSPALGPSIASVAGQLLEDTRTPPLVQQLRAQAELRHGQGQGGGGGQGGGDQGGGDQGSGGGQGEAVPVLLEDHELADERRVQQLMDRTHGGGGAVASTTRPQPGISTWVLLSGSNSTPAPEEPSSSTTTSTTTAAPGKNSNKKGAAGGKPAAGGATTTTTTTTTAPPHPQKAGGAKRPQTPRPPPSTAANNKLVQQFRPLLHSRPTNPAKLTAAATEPSTPSPQSATTTTGRTTTTRTTTVATPTTKKHPKTTTTTTTTVPPPAKANRTVEPEGVQLYSALTRQPPSKAKPGPAASAPTAPAFKRRPGANTTTTTTTTTTAAPQPTSTTAQPTTKATTSKVKTTATTTTTTITTPNPVTTLATRGPEEAAEGATETPPEESTTKRQRRPAASSGGGKKRKKNKNKRRKRPTNSQDHQPAESKVTELSPELKSPGNGSRPAGSKERPLSTRIYNYLAREVMPSVGVGLIGLVVTAGLAGLMLYPFGGGVAARRTYEEDQHRLRYPHQGGFLYYESAGPDGKPEEAVLREVFEGMAPADDEPVSSYHQPQGNEDADGTYSYSAGSPASGYGGHHYSGSYATMASSTTPPSAAQPAPYYSGHAEPAGEYRRPQYHQRLEATPKHAATAASPVASAGSASPEKFYGSEAVHVRTADVPKYSGGEGSDLSGQRQQEKAIGYTVVSAGDRVGTVEVAYGGRVRHQQLSEGSSAVAGHGPRSLDTGRDTATVQGAHTTEATQIKTRNRRDIAEDEVASPDSLLLDNDIVVWAKEKKWPPKKEMGSAKQPIKWMKVDSNPVQALKASTSDEPTTTRQASILTEKSTNLPPTTESATLSSEVDEEMKTTTRVDTDSQTTTDRGRLLEDTSGGPAVFVTEVATEESHTEASPNTSDIATLPAVEEVPTNGTGDSPASAQQNQVVSFTDVLRRIAHFKMRLGVSLLKSTAEAFSRYLGTVQERMEETLADARRARYHNGPGDGLAGVAFWNAVRRAQRGLFDRQRRRDE